MTKQNINYEQYFFQMILMDDIWTSIKIYMYPTKGKCSYNQYINGDMAAFYGYLNLIKEKNKEKKYILFTKNAMDWAAQNGYLEIVKWLHFNRKEGCTFFAMNWAAHYGHLEIVKWLHLNRKEGCSVFAIDSAARNGHLKVIKWLHLNRTESCTINAIDYAAHNGHLEVVEWLQNNIFK